MSSRHRHAIVEHIWRFLRAFFVLLGMSVWLAQDGWCTSDWFILVCGITAGILDQLHGYICNRIERFLKWQDTFDDLL